MINVIFSIFRLIVCRLTSSLTCSFTISYFQFLMEKEREYQRSLKRIEMFISLFSFHVVILENDS